MSKIIDAFDAQWWTGLQVIAWILLRDRDAVIRLPAFGKDVRGTVAKVHDGDTLALTNGTKIRLYGYDAPELRQQCRGANGQCVPCGEQARDFLSGLVLGAAVFCDVTGSSYDRIVGRCSAGGVDIDLAMLSAGQGLAYTKYLRGYDRQSYPAAEQSAHEAKLRIWATTFVKPEDWRHHHARMECER